MRALHVAFLIATLGLANATQVLATPHLAAPELRKDPRQATAGEYKLDLHHASVTMKLSHDGMSNYTLRFNGISGHYDYDPAHPTRSKIEVSIDPASIDTGDSNFNAKIAKDFLEAGKFPAITFTSTKIDAVGDHGTVEGVLDLHGVKKNLTLNVVYHGFEPVRAGRMGFSATATLKRSDFGVDFYAPAEADEVTVLIEAEFEKQASAPTGT
jgi:polyisoprenoid-binding protein YceI